MSWVDDFLNNQSKKSNLVEHLDSLRQSVYGLCDSLVRSGLDNETAAAYAADLANITWGRKLEYTVSLFVNEWLDLVEPDEMEDLV
jgi:hypothetical protein